MQFHPIEEEDLRRPLHPGAGLDVGAEIAHGGMGRVLHAHDRDLDRVVAMKVIRESDRGSVFDRRRTRRFVREARVTGNLQHPGIIPVYGMGVTADRRVYYTMPKVSGHSLEHVMARHRDRDEAWPTARIVTILAQICDTVAFAHERGVIHRDLKPSNIMIDEFHAVYVMDWGLARRVTDENAPVPLPPSVPESSDEFVTLQDTLIGTPEFMAPEQIGRRHDPVGPPADVHALGAILYSLLTGAWPYHTESEPHSPLEVIDTARRSRPTPIAEIAPTAPVELIAIWERATREHPEHRYHDAHEMGRDLRAFTEKRVVRAYRTGAWAELGKWVTRNPGVALAGLGILLVTLCAWGVAAWRARAASIGIAAERDVAIAAGDRIRNLAAIRRLSLFATRAAAAWPATSDRVRDLRALCGRGRSLLAEREDRAAELSELEAAAIPQTPAEIATERRAAEAALAETRGALDELAQTRKRLRDELPTLVRADRRAQRETIAMHDEQRSKLRVELTIRESAAGTRQAWTFADPTDAWRHDELVALMAAFDHLHDTMASLDRRLQRASSIRERTISGAAQVWARTRAEIRELPVYGGLDLPPQEGLLPISRNPRSGYWEFLHVPSGLGADAKNGIVLVLLPAGEFAMGCHPVDADHPFDSPSTDPRCVPHLESPVMKVRLSAFFVGKYEVTQGQWVQSLMPNPSVYRYATDRNIQPVHSVTFEAAREFVRRMDLALPTEAQWEYACRAGTTSVYWCGNVKSSLAPNENVASLELKKFFSPDGIEKWKDGVAGLSSVGKLRPNAFGLFDVHGSVREWCRDRMFAYGENAIRPGDGAPRHVLPNAPRVSRGGAWRHLADLARAAARTSMPVGFHNDALGLRVVREVRR